MEIFKGRTDCTPAETGYDGSRIDKLNERFESMIERRVIYGAEYCISHKGKVIAHAALGKGSMLGDGALMKPDTVFRIASLTKVFTATAIMQLVEDGIVNLSDYVSKFLPQFKEKPFSDIRIIDLLTHTSGLYPDSGCFDEPLPTNSWSRIADAYESWDRQGEFDWVKAGISAGLRRPVGKEWMYCSFGFCLLGEVITRAGGVYANDYIRNNILRPLGLNDTDFRYNADTAARAFCGSGSFKEYMASIVSGERTGNEQEEGFYDLLPSTSGGLHSTAYDLVRFGNAYAFGGRFDGVRLLGRKTVEKMSTPQLSGVPDNCWGAREPNRLYGIGFDIRRTPSFNYSDRTIMHEGAGASSLDIDLDEQLVAAWFVPFDEGAGGWSAEPLYNVQNIIWSGLI